MSSRIPRKFLFLGNPTNSLSPLNSLNSKVTLGDKFDNTDYSLQN